MIKTLFLSINSIISKIVVSNRLKYTLALVVISIIIGVTLKLLISYPTECSPVNNEKITYLFKI